MATKYRVCPLCSGEGTVVNRALSVWTGEDIANDPDGFEEMLSGTYDVACYRCDGLRVVTAQSERAYRQEREDMRTYAMESGQYDLLSDPY